MELYKSICVCSSDWRTASKTTKQKVKYIFNWVFQLWHNFLLQPLELIFKCFTSPTQGKYAWTGLDKVEAAFLNDFRLSRGYCMAWVIEFAWRCSLQIEETQKYFCHRFIHTKIKQYSFFATGIKPIEFVGADSQRNERQTDMMEHFWVYASNPKQWVTRHWNLSKIFVWFVNVLWRITVNFDLMRWPSFHLLWTLGIYWFPFCLVCKCF